MIGAFALALAAAPGGGLASARAAIDAPVPPPPPHLRASRAVPARELGTPVALFVNFDGIDLGECNPSNSKDNCHWYNTDPFEPFSGSMQTKVAVLQAMRRDVAGFGVRVTGVRPPGDESYVMVVYGGTEEQFMALGSAPSGDCLDANPNEVAFAHLDGERATWVNGGATTALHEAAHTWGLDHVGVEGDVMYPEGANFPTAFRDECDAIVGNPNLDPGDPSCPEVNLDFCPEGDLQNPTPLLTTLFGPPYVDSTAPGLELVEPHDGQYFQVPGSFDVVLHIDDDLHPQLYSMWAWMGDDPRPGEPSELVEPGFSVMDLPVGTWEFHIAIADEAGNESQLDFTVEVGTHPPPTDEGCACATSRRVSPPVLAGWTCAALLLLGRRRRHPPPRALTRAV